MILRIALALLATTSAPAPAPGSTSHRQEREGPAAQGVDGLTAAQRDVLSRVLAEEFCYCGCPHTVAGCLREHKACKHAPRMAWLAARLAATGAPAAEVRKARDEYYAGFDAAKRAKLDLESYGPPLGKPDAPVAVVEFSDFTCPYCRALKPELDRFVREHEGRVRLIYKPYPIASHPRAMEAALAAEWARERGVFWKMYDLLFAHRGELEDDDLAADARAAGADPEDLLRALASGRHRARVAASQAEARAAGLLGTPTLFFNGHRIQLPMTPQGAQALLAFVLEDEEEWAQRGGWARD
jgi:protein-disulfide isomerase